jgi:hypothetical protein
MPTRENPTPEWARVRILLNLGDVEAATVLAQEISADTRWNLDRGVRCGLAYILGVEDIPAGWAFFYFRPVGSSGQWFMLVNDRTLDEFGFCRSMFEYADACELMDDTSGWRRYDADSWRTLRDQRRAELGLEPWDSL